ncbi:Helix-turn-helix domain-containing protein [Pseudonocardia ammonioxydans]|uniref:Helix-turn-helix domain-containing protein n=1 Tax=Pseudonocardia ammonioxydans TaxID=260086 RepID=A0A1I5DZ99_PSUAM|nr:helix-turn-helix domain-containing protein [Pseudonocardia ammonioxydans]SFO04546.1 Helix-turn-helix domain-containing protein [Pseudonocardia ammonioxydans]
MADQVSLTELLHHPVRWRVVQALNNRTLTTGGLAAELPDVATTTLYRHVATLVSAGVIEVVAERRVRGAVERTYALAAPPPAPEPGSVSAEELRGMITSFLAGLSADLERYATGAAPDPVRDGLSMRQAALWLSDDELADLGARLTEVLGPVLEQGEAPGRRRRLFTTVVVPAPE